MSRPDVTSILRAMITISDHLSSKLDLPIKFPVLGEIINLPASEYPQMPSLMTPAQVAAVLGLSEKTLANYRASGIGGPPHVKNGGRVFYRRQDIVDHIERGVRSSTSHRTAKSSPAVPQRGAR